MWRLEISIAEFTKNRTQDSAVVTPANSLQLKGNWDNDTFNKPVF